MNAEKLAVKIGKGIKLKRLLNDLTRPELAKTSGVRALTIQRMENGQGSALGLDNLLPILDALNTDISDFLRDIGSQDDKNKEKNALDEKEFSSMLYSSIQSMPEDQKIWLKKLISNIIETNLEKSPIN